MTKVKRGLLMLFFTTLIVTAMANQYTPFEYVREFPTYAHPSAVTTDSDGSLYYVTLDSATSRFVFIDDPASCNSLTDQTVIVQAAFSTSRGWQSVSVDLAGNVYLSADCG